MSVIFGEAIPYVEGPACQDRFGRTTASGWNTGDDGQVWVKTDATPPVTPPPYVVGGTNAHVTPAAGYIMDLPAESSVTPPSPPAPAQDNYLVRQTTERATLCPGGDLDLLISFAASDAIYDHSDPTQQASPGLYRGPGYDVLGSHIVNTLLISAIANPAGFSFAPSVTINGDNAGIARAWLSRQSPAFSYFAPYAFAFTANQVYHLRIREDAAGTYVHVTLWAAGDPEPAAQLSDTLHGQTLTGDVAITGHRALDYDARFAPRTTGALQIVVSEVTVGQNVSTLELAEPLNAGAFAG